MYLSTADSKLAPAVTAAVAIPTIPVVAFAVTSVPILFIFSDVESIFCPHFSNAFPALVKFEFSVLKLLYYSFKFSSFFCVLTISLCKFL